MRFRALYIIPSALLPLVAALSASEFGCSTSTSPEAVRTFERAERLATVCIRVAELRDGVATAVDPVAVDDAECPKVPNAADARGALAHMIGFVTQTVRGELAVADLSAGTILDVDHTTPGIDPVVAPVLPTDVVVTSDKSTLFVAGGTPGAYALYGAPTTTLLGQALGDLEFAPPTLISYRACALPSRPTRIFPLPADAANPMGGPGKIAVVLGGDRLDPPRLLVIDAAPFGATGSLPAGGVGTCPIVGATDLVAAAGSAGAGNSWGTGTPLAGSAVSLPNVGNCSETDAGTDAGPGGDDAGIDGGADASAPLAEERSIVAEGALSGRYLYLADSANPLVHVIDLADPTKPLEIAPYFLSSVAHPERPSAAGAVAVSPPTHTRERFLYAVDAFDGTVAVFDATDPASASRAPRTRPHPELNPFAAPDRISFGAKAMQVAFARHDFPLLRDASGVTLPVPETGLLCNPHPNATDHGAAYAANGDFTTAILGPSRLRGIFGFVTLTNGEVTVVDVDDWDAPCRRPADLSSTTPVADGVPVMTTGASSDPYGAPLARAGATTDEIYFPVAAPHRARSSYFLRDDATQGRQIVTLTGAPSLALLNAPLPTQGVDGAKYPVLLPTRTTLRDFALATPQNGTNGPALVPGAPEALANVRFAWETPEVQKAEDWVVAYEGTLPGFDGMVASLSSSDGEQTLAFAASNASFCGRGVESHALAAPRAAALATAFASAGTVPSRDPSTVLGDYVQITNELLPASDAWWTDAVLPDSCEATLPGAPAARQALCSATFGSPVDQLLERDFPVLQSFDDHLVLGRFGYTDRTQGIAARQVVGADPSNAEILRRARCCFQDRVSFRVRSGGEWLATGSQSGLLHHLKVSEGGACVSSCDARDSLLTSRAFPSPRPTSTTTFVAPDRNDARAFRNPFFSFVMYDASKGAVLAGTTTVPTRDMTYRFTTRAGYSSLVYDLASQTIAVSPRSLQYIDALGEMAVVDGSSQGLVLIDLSTMALARPIVN